MLHEFITDNRDAIINLARAAVARRLAPRSTPKELEQGVPLFLTQLVELLQPQPGDTSNSVDSAMKHGGELLKLGFTVAQVVHDYGDICQAVTTLAAEKNAAITVREFRTLNLSLDDAIAGAVTGYAQQRDRWITHAESERMSAFSQELRNLLSTASLAFEILKKGTVGAGGSTGVLLGRTLGGLRDLVDRSLALVRLEQGSIVLGRVPVAELMEELEISATLEAQQLGVRLVVGAVEPGLSVSADRQILAAGVGNLLNNALMLSPRGGEVSIHTGATDERITIDITDVGAAADRSAGESMLSIGRRAIAANGGLTHTRELAGELGKSGRGFVITIDLPRMPEPS